MTRAEWDVLIFVLVLVATGWGGVWLNMATSPDDLMNGPGTLLWLVGPALAGIVLTLVSGKGFQRLGLSLNMSGNSLFYLIALLATPLVVFVVAAIGFAAGTVSAGPGAGMSITALIGATLVSTLTKNLFEELAWRGFLTPALEETRFAGFANHIITGLIWTLWHVPYWLFFISAEAISSQTGLPIAAFIALTCVMLILQSFLYGELRLATGSFWPAFILHSVTNVLSFVLLSGQLLTITGPLAAVLIPDSSGLLYSVLIFGLGMWLHARRTRKVLRAA